MRNLHHVKKIKKSQKIMKLTVRVINLKLKNLKVKNSNKKK